MMMTTPSALIEQTSRRLLNQRRANIVGFFLPLIVATGGGCFILLFVFSLPLLPVLVPLALLGTLMIRSLAKAQKTVKRETIAALLDEKTDGQERFLTYATLPQEQVNHAFFSILQRQAARKASSFEPSQDLPFKLDRKVPVALLVAALSVLLVIFLPSAPIRSFLFSLLPDDLAIEKLENAARELTKSADLEKQAAGAQLLALVEELKNPELSPQEKQHLIEEAQQKINLPLPQLLPFDLKLFASESKNEQGPGNQGDQPQPENAPLAKSDQDLEQLKKSPAAAAGQEPQRGPPQDGEKSDQSQPREAGGGIQFDLPQPQAGEKKEQAGNEPGQQRQASQDQAVNNQGPGTDPNRPGKGQEQNLGPEKDQQSPGSQQQQQQGTGTPTGGGAGERFLQPGERPGGFLTEEAQFVKVRIPIGQDAQEGGKRIAGRGGTLPKTPYSNAPLKEGAPDQPKPKQPIPLEYRAILQ